MRLVISSSIETPETESRRFVERVDERRRVLEARCASAKSAPILVTSCE